MVCGCVLYSRPVSDPPSSSQKPQATTTVANVKPKAAPIPPALRPEESLAPLGQIFATSANPQAFRSQLCEYIRALVGARWTILFENSEEGNIQPIAATQGATKTPEVDAVLAKAFKSFSSQKKEAMLQNQQHLILIVPFKPMDGNPVAIATALPPNRMAFAEPCFTILHLATQFLVQRELLTTAGEKEGAFDQATLLVEMISRTQERDTFARSLYSLSAELEKFFQCDRVAIGVKKGSSCRVEAVSGMTGDKLKNLGTSQLRAALTEAMSVGRMTVWPRQDDLPEDAAVSASHDDLMRSFQVDRMVVAPFFEAEQAGEDDERTENPVGAIALLWSGAGARQSGVTPYTFNLLRAARPHLSALVQLLQKGKPGRFRNGLAKVFGGSLGRRLGLFLLGAFVGTVLIFPIEYKVGADCLVQAMSRRTIAAPFESRLERSNVKPGDVVEKDQILAELDGREIRVKLGESIAAQNAALKKRDQSMVGMRPAELQMAQFEADRLALEVKRLQYQNDNLLIRAPIDGVVLTGNLERSAGVPVSTGQKLFEIAPLNEMRVEIFIPEQEIRHVEKDDLTFVRLEARGADRLETVLQHIHPVSETESGDNVFVGEAVLSNEDESLRPGMRGKARIEAGKKPIGWILFHRLYEWLRLKLW